MAGKNEFGATSFQRRGRRVKWDEATVVTRRSGTNRTTQLLQVRKSMTPRYAGGASVGRRIAELEADQAVSKASRYYDADARRRHQQGAVAGAAGVGGAGLFGAGVRGAARDTKNFGRVRWTPPTRGAGAKTGTSATTKDELQFLRDIGAKRGKGKIPNHLVISRRQAGLMAGGAGLGALAVGTNRRARSDKNRTWS